MTPSENLNKDHEVINELLNIMSKIELRIKSKSVFYTCDIELIIDFLKNFIEKIHHEKEKILYPALKLAAIPIDKEVVSIMLHEHILIRSYLKDIINCIVNCKMGSNFSEEMLAESLGKYVLLKKIHIQKELDIFFPIADKHINYELQQKILNHFEEIEERIEAHNFQTCYNILLKDLKNKYRN